MSQSLFSPKSSYLRLLRYVSLLLGALGGSGIIAYFAVAFLASYPSSGDTGIAPDLSGVPKFLFILFIGWILPLAFFLRPLRAYGLTAKIIFFVIHAIGYNIIISLIFSYT